MNPKISIIVPVYNIDKYLSNCLDSILDQTFTDFEVIAVNDGSTDQSGSICEAYATRDQRIKVVHKKHGGVSSSRNLGVEHAKGDYIGFVDGDDYIHAHMYHNLYERCMETESDISICKLGREIDGKLINHIENPYMKVLNNEEAMDELFKGTLYRFSLCNKLFHKHCFAGVQFPEGRIHEDLSTTYQLFAKANKVVYTNRSGYIYVKRKNSILTTRFHEKRLDSLIGWNEILLYMKQHYQCLLESVYSCFGYWCVDQVYYILNQVEDKQERKKYLEIIRKIVNTNYRELMYNQILSFKYKYIVSILHYHINLLLFSNRLKRFIFKR